MLLEVDAEDVARIRVRVDDVTERAQDLRPVWQWLAGRWQRMERRVFASQGASYGAARWAPLSPRYAAWKARRFPGQPILRATDQMYRSVTERPFGIEVLDRQEMVLGTRDPKARFHQRGTSRMPARPFVVLPQRVAQEWANIITQYVTTGDV